MVPKPYDCPRCNRPLSTSGFEKACEECRTLDESQELLAKWPEMRRFMWLDRGRAGYIPPGLWYAMVEIAMTNGIAIKEVEVTLIRRILEKDFGFKCDHPEEKVEIKNHDNVYCKMCWSRLEVISMRKMNRLDNGRMSVTPGVYRRKKSFIDLKEEVVAETDPLSSLKPDLRGGEWELNSKNLLDLFITWIIYNILYIIYNTRQKQKTKTKLIFNIGGAAIAWIERA
jgi:Zn finger protein HypA/HybF involved in hydrogenase expression